MSPFCPVAFLALASVAAPVPDEPAAYRWKFEKGKTFYQETTTETRQAMKVKGQDVIQTQRQTFCFSWTPLRQAGPNCVIRWKIEGIKMEVETGGAEIAYDSTGPGGGHNPLSDFLKAVVGSEFTLTLDRDLKLVKVSGNEEFARRLGSAYPQLLPLLGQIFSELVIKDMVELTFSAPPPRPLEKGESWAKACRLEMGPVGLSHLTCEYVFQGREGKLVQFRLDNFNTRHELPRGHAGGLPFTINQADLRCKKGSGALWFDTDKGRLNRSDMHLEIQGALDIDVGGQKSTVELAQVHKTTTRITDSNPLQK